MLRPLVARDLKVRYAGSALGYLWSVLDPLLMSLVYSFVFTEIFKRQGGLPRRVGVLRLVMSKGTECLFALTGLALFAILYAKRPNIQIMYMPLAIVMTLILLTGIGLTLTPLTVLVRDIERIVPVLLRVMFYFSPIPHNIPKHRTLIASFNPPAGTMVLFRSTFFPQELGWHYVEHSAIGVVGRNGQGKPTLLSLIAGVLLPDEGTVEVRAGVAPLIQITGGFEGEVTARENIYLVSGLHGMTRREIADAFGFCTRGLYLDGGALRGDGPLDEILRQYDVASGTVASTLSSLDDAASAAG